MITKFDEYINEGIITDRYDSEEEDDNYSGVMSSHFKHASDEYKKEDEVERNLLSFSYKGNKLPTEEMINWFNDEDRIKNDEHFFDDFHDELIDLSYMEMLDIFKIASEKANL